MSIIPFSKELAQELYNSSEQFPVDFDHAWQWLEYSRKDNAKTSFGKCKFIQGLDFRLLKVKETRQDGSFSHYVENISLTVDCFKHWAMMSGTEKGKEVRLYFLECERIAKAAISTQVAQPKMTLTEVVCANSTELVKHEKQLAAMTSQVAVLENRVDAIESVAITARTALVEASAPMVTVQSLTTRKKVVRLVRSYAGANHMDYQFVWRALYREFRDRYCIDIKTRAKNAGVGYLDMCEQLGKMEELYAVAYDIFR